MMQYLQYKSCSTIHIVLYVIAKSHINDTPKDNIIYNNTTPSTYMGIQSRANHIPNDILLTITLHTKRIWEYNYVPITYPMIHYLQ